MTALRRPRLRLPDRRQAVVLLPNGFTAANLFFGIFAIVSASRGQFELAARWVVLGAVADMFDGRVARATGSGSRFGEEMDSLVDGISFGLAPAMIAYFAVLNRDGWDWIFSFIFTLCAVIRLARFNVVSAGRKKTHFQGLPSPAAGGTLATYFWFSQTELYNETVIGEWPWHQVLRFLMLLLAFLMVSNVPYPAWPTFTFRTVRGTVGIVLMVAMLIGLIVLPREFFFPLGVAYVAYGLLAAFVAGLTDQGPDEDFLGEEEDPDEPLVPPRVPSARPHRHSAPSGVDVTARTTPLAPPAISPVLVEEHGLEGPPTAPGHKKRRRRRRPRGDRPGNDRGGDRGGDRPGDGGPSSSPYSDDSDE